MFEPNAVFCTRKKVEGVQQRAGAYTFQVQASSQTNMAQDHHRERDAALSQSSAALNGTMEKQDPAGAGEGRLRPTSLGGSGSPDTMERGMMPLVPSPFHSDRVRAEIELQRRCPETLDRDAATMAASSDTAAKVAKVDTAAAPQEAAGPKCLRGWMGRARNQCDRTEEAETCLGCGRGTRSRSRTLVIP